MRTGRLLTNPPPSRWVGRKVSGWWRHTTRGGCSGLCSSTPHSPARTRPRTQPVLCLTPPCTPYYYTAAIPYYTRKPRYTPLRYAALASAPSRSLELRAVDQWLERVGVLEAFCAVNPKVRLHRASSLPQAEDVFTPELAPGGIVFRF